MAGLPVSPSIMRGARMIGVEQNEESRYVDYTKATDWEDLIYDLGQAIKKVAGTKAAGDGDKGWDTKDQGPSMSLEYQGVRMVLSLLNVKGEGEEVRKVPSTAPDFQEWFSVKTPLLSLILPETNEESASTESDRRRIFSALAIALGSISSVNGGDEGCPWPVFCKATKSDNVLGYAVTPDVGTRVGGHIVHNYYSSVVTDVNPHSKVYYIEGLVDLFRNDLAFMTGVVPEFSFDTPVAVNVSEWHVGLLKDFNSTLSYRKRHEGNGSHGTPIATMHAGDAHAEGAKPHPLVLGTLEDLWAICPQSPADDQGEFTAGPDMYVAFHWGESGHCHIIENGSLTNLQPHTVPRENWSISAVFKSNEESDGHAYLAWGARRLLSLYILGKAFLPTNVSTLAELVGTRTSGEDSTWDEAVASALVLTEPLSDRGKAALLGMIQTTSEDESIETDLEVEGIMRLFASALYVSDMNAGDSSDGVRPVYDTKPGDMNAWMPGAPPVGGFLSRLSVTIANMTNVFGMNRVWTTCLKQLRLQWEKGIPLAHIHSLVGLSGEHNFGAAISTVEQGVDDHSRGLRNLSEYMLWGDVATKLRSKGTNFIMPSLSSSIAHQKLQMLDICILCKEENSYVEPPFTALFASSSEPYVVPKLMRRFPATKDKVDWKDYALSKIEHSSTTQSPPVSPSSKAANCLERARNDVIVSDMRSFKHANPSHAFDLFLHFYTLGNPGTVEENDVELWKRLWDGCEGQSVDEQKRLFNIESEAEQALNFLERLSSSTMGSEFLVAFISTAHFMLKQRNISLLRTLHPRDASLEHDMKELEDTCITAIKAMREEDPGDGAVSQDLLLAVDRACVNIERVELFHHHMESLGEFAKVYPRLSVELCLKGTAVPASDDELDALWTLAETIYADGTRDMAWYTSSTRELPFPCRRRVELGYPMGAPRNLQHKLVAIRDGAQNMRISMQFTSPST